MDYAIDTFWKQRFSNIARESIRPSLTGWTVQKTPYSSFVEAELKLREEQNNLEVPIWFVAAPGAVGKSTLAKQISAQTGAVYLDLAQAETVAGNYLTGGLAKNDLLSLWDGNQAAILIDALDEARLRVTQKSFEDFLKDVVAQAKKHAMPTVLFGRVGIIDEAWLILSECGLQCPVFDIEFFDPLRARKFVMSGLNRLKVDPKFPSLAASLNAHQDVYEDATEKFVARLEKDAGLDGAKFSGYAPVLDAVATVLANTKNPATLIQSINQQVQEQVLLQLTSQILDREAVKMREQLSNDISPDAKEKLYGAEEQLDQLAAFLLGASPPSPPVNLPQHLRAIYDGAVKNFLPQHPFLDGSGKRLASGAVFAAAVNVHGLFSKDAALRKSAESHAGNGPQTPNPFLVDFYLRKIEEEKSDIPPEHAVFLYESLRARIAKGDTAWLNVEGDDTSEKADVEIYIQHSGVAVTEAKPQLSFEISQAGTLRFGRDISGATIDAPQLDVSIGLGGSVEMIAPVVLNVARLEFNCKELTIQPRHDFVSDGEDATVVIDARETPKSNLSGVPIVRQGAKLSVYWPHASSYPWTSFAGGEKAPEQNLDHALRALRRLVLAFRSHSKGQLARFKGKVEHERMTKGEVGVAIRARMMQDGILSIQGNMYILDPNKLGKVVGATFQDLKLRQFNDNVCAYIRSIVSSQGQ